MPALRHATVIVEDDQIAAQLPTGFGQQPHQDPDPVDQQTAISRLQDVRLGDRGVETDLLRRLHPFRLRRGQQRLIQRFPGLRPDPADGRLQRREARDLGWIEADKVRERARVLQQKLQLPVTDLPILLEYRAP